MPSLKKLRLVMGSESPNSTQPSTQLPNASTVPPSDDVTSSSNDLQDRIVMLENQLLYEQGANIKLNSTINYLLLNDGKLPKIFPSYSVQTDTTDLYINKKHSALNSNTSKRLSSYQLSENLKINRNLDQMNFQNNFLNEFNIDKFPNTNLNVTSACSISTENSALSEHDLISFYQSSNQNFNQKIQEKIQENNKLKIKNENLQSTNNQLKNDLSKYKSIVSSNKNINISHIDCVHNNLSIPDLNHIDDLTDFKNINELQCELSCAENVSYSTKIFDEAELNYKDLYDDPTRSFLKIGVNVFNNYEALRLLDYLAAVENYGKFNKNLRYKNTQLIKEFANQKYTFVGNEYQLKPEEQAFIKLINVNNPNNSNNPILQNSDLQKSDPSNSSSNNKATNINSNSSSNTTPNNNSNTNINRTSANNSSNQWQNSSSTKNLQYFTNTKFQRKKLALKLDDIENYILSN
ncbi:uncharacterized protein ASCRUDRAFT_77804 [Ascoidea rubescens DSM 1968]|uniref:Uncharacterized protein n=1 Tax=Ascoidea rubescens DSM 1968 TaxID=1344418 RepID=A0A1D2VA57_9ASCO|nr:hypothetical protein ASCRUDRAFT_77804 [Ascoidea rubescens DSM 1968]ODV58552.1 hypothetical protein ASCRUDRAFT_77804 [Ascoidea rubescens DSM 1968]